MAYTPNQSNAINCPNPNPHRIARYHNQTQSKVLGWFGAYRLDGVHGSALGVFCFFTEEAIRGKTGKQKNAMFFKRQY